MLRPNTATRLVDALAVLLVRLHNVGFFWGDVSLSNTLFRRDAGAFAAYLVDAETGELHEAGLSDGQREHDLDVARVNIAGEIMDLEAGGRLEGGVDAIAIADGIVSVVPLAVGGADRSRDASPPRSRGASPSACDRLNELGFDIGEMSIQATADGTKVSIQPKVVDAGHHQRRLIRLTGLDVEENQARRLLNDLDEFRARISRLGSDEEMVAHEWLTRVFEPVVRAIPFRPARQARARGGLPPGARAPLVHVAGAEPRRAARGGADVVHRRRAAPPPRRGHGHGPADRDDVAAGDQRPRPRRRATARRVDWRDLV